MMWGMANRYAFHTLGSCKDLLKCSLGIATDICAPNEALVSHLRNHWRLDLLEEIRMDYDTVTGDTNGSQVFMTDDVLY